MKTSLYSLFIFSLTTLFCFNAKATVHIVNSNSDDGAGSLREAVSNASSGDTILFDASLNGGEISLSSGSIMVTTNLVIIGPGVDQLSLTSSGSFSFFDISYDNENLTERSAITDFTFKDISSDDAAGVYTQEPTVILDCKFINCQASDDAGAIMSYDTLYVENCDFEDNTAGDDAGSFMTFDKPAYFVGCNFSNNYAGDDAGVFMNFHYLYLSECTFTNDSCGNEAGVAMAFDNLYIEKCSFMGNKSINAAGAISNFDSLFVRTSTFESNRAGNTGGAMNNYEICLIVNSTLSGNYSGTRGGGICNYGFLGVSFSTIAFNSADSAGAGIQLYDNMSMKNCLVADNSAPKHQDIFTEFGSIQSGGGNLIGVLDNGTINPVNSDIIGSPAEPVDAGLLALEFNGGSTKTHALSENSPAIDAAAPDTQSIDQRGYPRPFGNSSDIGAYEFGSTLTSITQHHESESIMIFPNPGNGRIWIKIQDQKELEQIQVMNSQGQLVKSLSINQNSFDISMLKVGLYLIQLNFENGKMSTEKLIIR